MSHATFIVYDWFMRALSSFLHIQCSIYNEVVRISSCALTCEPSEQIDRVLHTSAQKAAHRKKFLPVRWLLYNEFVRICDVSKVWSEQIDRVFHTSVSGGTNLYWDFRSIWIGTNKFEFLDLEDFGSVGFSVETFIPRVTHWDFRSIWIGTNKFEFLYLAVETFISRVTLSTAMNLVHRNSFPKLSNFS